MKRLFAALIILCLGLEHSSAAISLITDDDIMFRSKEGVLNGKIAYDNFSFQAIGTYKVDSKKNVTFEIDRLMNNGKIYTLMSKPKLTRKLKDSNTKLPKGQNLSLSGENQKEFQEFAQIVANAPSTEEKNAKKTNQSKSGTNASAGQGSSVGNISVGSGGTGSTMPYFPLSSTNTALGETNTETTWSKQFCSVPEYLTNSVKLSIIDKDGKCVEKMAVRDDTKCEYRLDFDKNKAIKQTQYYYIDNESKVQNLGDCVDLVGEEYQSEMWRDDTRCSLSETEKDYGNGVGTFFTTQVLYRGLDGLIYEATDCIAYGKVNEELIEYEKNNTTKQAQRIVNQYYIDPFTEEQIFINKGVKTDKVFDYKEKSCGDWVMDDANLKGKKRTELSFYDDVEGKEEKVTACDYTTTAGKKSEYTMEYTHLEALNEAKPTNEEITKNFHLNLFSYREFPDTCKKKCGVFSTCSYACPYQALTNTAAAAWTTTYTKYDVTKKDVYIRPDGSEYIIYYDPTGKNERFYEWRRKEIPASDSINLNEEWRTYYEVHRKHFENDTTKNIEKTTEYKNWTNNGTNFCVRANNAGGRNSSCAEYAR
ncbi:hypothetical protein LS71_008385 [Helicobacter jaachi]|uniref:Uncharacterized protein n=1 Tax=Helicobacter jaachi TaxID=1677920 RepID=A0A4U8T7C0_9HELI|nr:hypothetical protein [Helicobacter jaachi]TLD95414.1 hypothetical protein LS71_008385 [Helicobacter jaachi]